MFSGTEAYIGSAARKSGGAFTAALRLAAIAAAAATIAACAGDPETAGPLGCPRVAIVAGAEKAVQFRPGGGRDLTDLASRAEIADFLGECDYDDDGVSVALRVRIVAERGPALTGNRVDYSYFVAVADRDQNLLASEVFAIDLTFAGGQNFAAVVEELEQVIPLASPQDGRRYQVLLGFRLTRDQLQFNRR